MGDVVLSLPALKALRASFPKDHLAVVARPWVADLYRLRPEVDEVLVEDPKDRARLARDLSTRGFGRAILLPTSFGTAWTVYRARIPERIGWRGEWRAPLLTTSLSPRVRPVGEHEVWKHLRLIGAAEGTVPEHPDTSWALSKREREAGGRFVAAAGLEPGAYVAAHVASFAHAAKRWPLPRFAALFARVARSGLKVALLGSAGERAQNAEVAAALPEGSAVDLAGRTTLPEALRVLALARAFVGNDSGLAHLAAASGTPTVVVFGPTDPAATRPWDGPRGDGLPPRVTVVRWPPLCAPCRYRVCPIDHRCMEGITVEAVERALSASL